MSNKNERIFLLYSSSEEDGIKIDETKPVKYLDIFLTPQQLHIQKAPNPNDTVIRKVQKAIRSGKEQRLYTNIDPKEKKFLFNFYTEKQLEELKKMAKKENKILRILVPESSLEPQLGLDMIEFLKAHPEILQRAGTTFDKIMEECNIKSED